MADAFRYAEGGPPTREILLLQYIDRFGPQAVLGRPLYYREIRRLLMIENIQIAYKAQTASKDFAQWAKDNPKLAELLNRARTLKIEMYGTDDG